MMVSRQNSCIRSFYQIRCQAVKQSLARFCYSKTYFSFIFRRSFNIVRISFVAQRQTYALTTAVDFAFLFFISGQRMSPSMRVSVC